VRNEWLGPEGNPRAIQFRCATKESTLQATSAPAECGTCDKEPASSRLGLQESNTEDDQTSGQNHRSHIRKIDQLVRRRYLGRDDGQKKGCRKQDRSQRNRTPGTSEYHNPTTKSPDFHMETRCSCTPSPNCPSDCPRSVSRDWSSTASAGSSRCPAPALG
jgi:hypothetical protein